MRVLLVKPYQPVENYVVAPPLGLLYLVSVLRQRFGPALEVEFLDMKVERREPRWLAEHLRDRRPDVVGVSALNCEAAAAHEIAQLVKRVDAKILTVLGGPYPHRRAAELLAATEFDWVCDGPAERVFPEALARHFAGEPIGTDLPGVSYKTGDGVHVADGQDVIKDLDALPWPAWDLVDFDAYAAQPNQMSVLKGRRYATLFTSRGCPYKCNYCHDLFGKRFLYRSADDVIAEIAYLVERHGVDEFEIVDDIFNLHKPRLKQIMAEAARRWGGRIHFCFPNGLRADVLDESVLDALKQGGTYALSIAIETVTPRLQQLVEKHLDLEKAGRMIDAADRRGMMVTGFFMLGFPTETPEELRATVEFAVRSRLSLAYFFSVTPQPATPMHALARTEGARALAETDESKGGYRGTLAWYERAYGFALRRFVIRAYARFYGNPARILRILRRVPRRSLVWGLRRLLAIVADRPEIDGNAVRSRA
jgi:radical SAM superfamily enzyme YgiQ (UPF0313 family)